MTETPPIPSAHPGTLDDEMTALAMQLEEFGLYHDSKKGKYGTDNPPDSEIAYAMFQADLERYKTFLADHRLAHSIGTAVDSDAAAIAQTISEELRSHEDRILALRMRDEDPESQEPPGLVTEDDHERIQELMSVAESQYAGSDIDGSENETEAGPSSTYAERQKKALGKLSSKAECVVCREWLYSSRIISLPCNDRYCVDCLVGLFTRATKDETLFPVRCHQQHIPVELVSKHMTPDQLAAFELASLEFSTVDRTYCSNQECSKFIPPNNIESGTHRARCEECNTDTCALCKARYHVGVDCPDDPAVEQTRNLAREMGWQTCYRCGSVVVIRSGCNHMTCVFPHLKLHPLTD